MEGGNALLPGWPGAGAEPGVCACAGATAPEAGYCAAAAGDCAVAAGDCAAAGCGEDAACIS